MIPVLLLSLRALIRGRRLILVGVLLAIPALLALAYITSDPHPNGSKFSVQLLDTFFLPALLPLTALLFGTIALGGEIDSGTLTYLTLRPISRLAIVVAKLIAAAAVTLILIEAGIILTYLIAAGGAFKGQIFFALLLAGLTGALVYSAAFLTLGLFFPRRGLVIGFAYVLGWEGTAAGLSSALATLSIRRYVLSILHAALGSSSLAREQTSTVSGTAAVLVLALVIVAAVVVAVGRLKTMEQR